MFKQVLTRAKLSQTFRPHDMRHSAATRLLENGADLFAVSRFLGHSTITETANTYGHISEKIKSNLAEKMEQIASRSDAV